MPSAISRPGSRLLANDTDGPRLSPTTLRSSSSRRSRIAADIPPATPPMITVLMNITMLRGKGMSYRVP